jgi:protein-disulfide isomerase
MKPSPITEHDHTDGPEDARVTLIEYGDYECPFCVRAYPVIEAVRETFRGRLRFVYRHVPRSVDRGFAKQAAEASEFAASAGAFWPMHRELFLNPDRHELDQLVGYAAGIGLDREACRIALVERRFQPRVKELVVAATQSGIIGTPMLFLNEERYEDRVEHEPLLAAIERAFEN